VKYSVVLQSNILYYAHWQESTYTILLQKGENMSLHKNRISLSDYKLKYLNCMHVKLGISCSKRVI